MSYLIAFAVGYTMGTIGITTVLTVIVFTTGITYSGIKSLTSFNKKDANEKEKSPPKSDLI